MTRGECTKPRNGKNYGQEANLRQNYLVAFSLSSRRVSIAEFSTQHTGTEEWSPEKPMNQGLLKTDGGWELTRTRFP